MPGTRRPVRIPDHPLVSMALAMLLVGATAPLGELALSAIPLFPVLAIRLALAWACLAALRPDEPGPRLGVRGWSVLAVQAFCGVVVFNAAMWLGMRTTGPVTAGIVTSVTPAVMAVLGVLAFRARLSLANLGGIVLTMAGVLAARGGLETGRSMLEGSFQWGDLLLLAAVAGESVFLLALKWLPVALTPLDAARRVTCLGFWLVLPLAVWQGTGADVYAGLVGSAVAGGLGAHGTPLGVGGPSARVGLEGVGNWTQAWIAAGLGPWLAVAALGMLVTAGGYVLWFRGVRNAPAGSAAAVTGLMPVSAVFSSWLLLGLAPTPGQLAGCLAAGAGIWLAARERGGV